MAPGRWNRPGEEAIYTSTEIAVPLLERLAHSRKDLIPSNLALMRIRISGVWESHKNALTDARTGGSIWLYPSVADAKEHFQNGYLFGGGINPFAIAVPSVIVPAWNVVLYPKGIGFWKHVSLIDIEPFEFDPRLFPEDAQTEVPEIA